MVCTHPKKEFYMGNTLDIYKAYYDASWANPPASILEANEAYLSDDFKSLEKDGSVAMDRKTYVGMGAMMFTAFDDMKFVINELREEGDSVFVKGHFEGTHTGDFDLSAMGMGVIPASGKKIVWPESSNKFTVKGDKIVSITNLESSNSAAAFLEPLGVELPTG
jgi:predicted ester cyclase